MIRKINWLFIVFVLAIGLFGCEKTNNANKIDDEEKILFYGDGCPHCGIVDDYINENDVETKIEYHHLEVWNNQDNADLLVDRAEKCGLDTQRIGVPFFWDGEKCYIGDVDIIDYFKNQTGEGDNGEEENSAPETDSEPAIEETDTDQ